MISLPEDRLGLNKFLNMNLCFCEDISIIEATGNIEELLIKRHQVRLNCNYNNKTNHLINQVKK